MIKVSELYNDFVQDSANSDENGTITFIAFNRMLWKSQLRLMSWLTGSMDDPSPPEKISPQKSRDLLSIFLAKYPTQVANGEIAKPTDYYLFHNIYKIKGTHIECADEYEEETLDITKKPIELLDNSKFTTRSSTWIERLKPKNKPIAKLSGAGFEFLPEDVGSVVLEYYRYPTKAALVSKPDTIYHNQVVDEDASTNCEFSEMARPFLLHFLNQEFALNTREVGFQQQNQMNKP